MATKAKVVIRPFKQQNHMDAAAAQSVLADLRRAIDEIYKKNASTLSFEELYRNAYKLVLHKHGDLLYDGVADIIAGHLRETAENVANTPNDRLLQVIADAWEEHKITLGMIKDILMYMDRTYVVHRDKTPVYKLGLRIFRDVVAWHPQVRDRLKEILLESIHNERLGQMIDQALMKEVLGMHVELGIDGTSVYETEFESAFLDATRNFYRQESVEYIAQNTCPDYMRKVETRLVEEQNRVERYLHPATAQKLKQVVDTELISNHASALVEMENSGCVVMMNQQKIEDLRRMYMLFSRVPATLDLVRDCMSQYVKRLGGDILADQETTKDPVVFVQNILDLKSKFDDIVTNAFKAEKQFQKRLQESFEDFINKDIRTSSYLASYVDDLLKTKVKTMPEEEFDTQLERAIVIFRFLQDKDIFENFYKQHLAKRLLAGRSGSDDAERSMISKLKTECGYQFTSKLEGMFTDMRISKDTMDEYRTTNLFHASPVELEVSVLTTGYWPVQLNPSCNLPPTILHCCSAFEEFYFARHSGRKLAWQAALGTADVRANFPMGRRELNVSTYQMCILMLFNEADTFSLDAIRQATQIHEPELRRHLLSLCTPKHRILNKASKGKGIAADDTFTFNAEYTSKLRRVKVPLISARDNDGGDQSSAIPAPVEEDRRHLVEATVVRIMKARKNLSHNELVAETTRQLSHRFVPPPQFIRKRIESLIEREYLERDASDRRLYKYLA